MPIDPDKTFKPINIAVLTVSDTRTAADDTSGDILAERVTTAGHKLIARAIEKDDAAVLADRLSSWIDDPEIDAIVSTGGTGLTGRDVTPEAIEDVCDKFLPGFGEAMRATSLAQGVPTAILSRQTAAILGASLVVTLPGKPGSIRVCLDAVFPAIPYCIDLIGGPYLEGDPAVVQVFRPKKK